MFIFSLSVGAQTKVHQVLDAETHKEIPFATIKFITPGHGIVADLHGRFELDGPVKEANGLIEISCLGYEPVKVPANGLAEIIFLRPAGNIINEVTFKPDYEKVRRILGNAIVHKSANNPDKLEWYQCKVYYKMIVDAGRTDTTTTIHKPEENRLSDFLKNQHLMLSETYSRRTWKRPGQLQEDVLLNKLSGFKMNMFTSLVTDVLPFHAYSDYLTINGRDYHNPVSRGYEKYYSFNLKDEVVHGADTTWVLSFFPLGHMANELKGRVYINSGEFAISSFVADATDTLLRLTACMEQQYSKVRKSNGELVWFPQHLNYVIHWHQEKNGKSLLFDMKGTTDIDSVNLKQDPDFQFDKGHTLRIAASAAFSDDAALQKIRASPLDEKEKRSYNVIDSIGEEAKLDKKISFFSRSMDWKVPVNVFDVDLRQLFAYNEKEGVRAGMGLQTNDKISKRFSVGGYGAYGFGDKVWKYGMFGEMYFNRYREFLLHAGYSDDIYDPGRIHLFADIDKNYLNSYLLWRVDRSRSYTLSLHKKMGYLNCQISASRDFLQPQYACGFESGGNTYHSFNDKQAVLRFRYAYGETTAPFFQSYYSLSSSYPVCYAKLTYGILDSGKLKLPYAQVVSALVWNKHINRLGYEHIRIMAGASLSNSPLPLSRLFAANGYNYVTSGADPSVYTLGGMMTLSPYQCYSERFLNIIYRHDFDWKLYALESADFVWSSVPHICLQYDLLWGGLSHPEAQQGVDFIIPYNAYQEIGLLLKSLLRMRFANLYYITFDYGCFYHPSNKSDPRHDTRMVFGAGIDL